MISIEELQVITAYFTAELIKHGVIIGVPHARLQSIATAFSIRVSKMDIKAIAKESLERKHRPTEEEVNEAIKNVNKIIDN